jgi:hypothetical protein
MLEPIPHRTKVICVITVFGSTPSASFMNVPFGSGSAIGPNDIAFLQPSTSTKNVSASFMSGTVIPVWSCPRIPGSPFAWAAPSASVMANVVAALQRPVFRMFCSLCLRRCVTLRPPQLAFVETVWTHGRQRNCVDKRARDTRTSNKPWLRLFSADRNSRNDLSFVMKRRIL